MMRKKGQFGTEFIIVVGFALMFMMLGFSLILFQSREQEKQTDYDQLRNFGQEVLEAVNRVSYSQKTAKATIKSSLPDGVKGVDVENRYFLVFNYSWGGDIVASTFDSDVPIEIDMQNLGKGKKTILVENRGEYVLICDKDSLDSCDKICTSGESVSDSPSDCCLSDCSQCMSNTHYLNCSSNDTVFHSVCCFHNGCVC